MCIRDSTNAGANDFWLGVGDQATISLPASATGYVVTLFDYDIALNHPTDNRIDAVSLTGGASYTGNAFADGQGNLSNPPSVGAGSGNVGSFALPVSIPSSATSLTLQNTGNFGFFYFDVCAAAVPEPSALMALGFAGMPLAGLAWFRKRRQAVIGS